MTKGNQSTNQCQINLIAAVGRVIKREVAGSQRSMILVSEVFEPQPREALNWIYLRPLGLMTASFSK